MYTYTHLAQFDSRNLDIEAADEETFQEMALGFKMVMRVMGNGGGALASSSSGVESDDDAVSLSFPPIRG